MIKPKFNNTENDVHIVQLEGGNKKMIWNSRSVAMHGVLMIRVSGIDYILLIKRSSTCLEEPSKFANVTGFLDWGETAINGLKREYWEETRIDFDKYFNESNLLKGDLNKPYFVQTDPGENNQVVVLRYSFLFELDDFPDFNVTDEVDVIEFVPIDRIKSRLINYADDFAWNHEETIKDVLEIFKDAKVEPTIDKNKTTELNIKFNVQLTDKFNDPDTIARVYYPDEGSRIVVKKGLSRLEFEESLFHEFGHIIDWYISDTNQSDNTIIREVIADGIEESLVSKFDKIKKSKIN